MLLSLTGRVTSIMWSDKVSKIDPNKHYQGWRIVLLNDNPSSDFDIVLVATISPVNGDRLQLDKPEVTQQFLGKMCVLTQDRPAWFKGALSPRFNNIAVVK